MKKINRILNLTWKVYFSINFLLSFLVMYPIFYVLLLSEKTKPLNFKVMRFWGKYLVLGGGARWKVIREADLPEPPYIICPNHSSYLDIILTYCVFPDFFIFMAKKELGDVPLFKVFFKVNILVDRKSNSGSHKAFLRAAEEIDKGRGMAIFPEGTISKKAPAMGNFKNGAFKLAAEKGIPIVPVTFTNNWEILGDGPFWKARCRPGKAMIYIHPPVTVASTADSDINEAKEKVYTLLNDKISESLQNKQVKTIAV